MKFVVTGAAGFIGSSICARLLEDTSNTVLGVDCITNYYDADLKNRNLAKLQSPRFAFDSTDLAVGDVDSLVEDVDVIFHQAGQPGVRSSWGKEFQDHVGRNVVATQRLLEAVARRGNLSRFVFASSSSVYGDQPRYPVAETALPMPNSPYGVTKLAAENLVTLYARNYGVPAVSLRYFTVYGPGQRPDMAFTRFLRAAYEGGEIGVYGTGAQERDFTFIDDIVEANMKAIDSRATPGSVINISGGSIIRLEQAIDTIAEISETKLNIVKSAAVSGDVFRTDGNSESARELLGWKPAVTLREGLTRQWAWVKEQYSA